MYDDMSNVQYQAKQSHIWLIMERRHRNGS